eukprot:scaffold151940_cov71-Cyclotella_meneghiniana.AAC.3
MKLSSACLTGVIGLMFMTNNANAKLGDSDAADIADGKELISESTYNEAQKFLNDALRDIMQEFSSHSITLHHPLFFSRRSFPSLVGGQGNKSFSSWDPFSIAGASNSIKRLSPRYEVVDDESSFAIRIDVPGFHFHELNVDLESGGRILCISGTKEDVNEERDQKEKQAEESTGESESTMKYISHAKSFLQKFTLDPSIDSSKMTANLDPEQGTLVIRAPRVKRNIEYKRHVPITQ